MASFNDPEGEMAFQDIVENIGKVNVFSTVFSNLSTPILTTYILKSLRLLSVDKCNLNHSKFCQLIKTDFFQNYVNDSRVICIIFLLFEFLTIFFLPPINLTPTRHGLNWWQLHKQIWVD